jgi:type IV secretion system protein VirB11
MVRNPIEQPVNSQAQQQPVVQPVQPRYQTYNQSTDAPTQAQPVQPVQPVQQQNALANAAPVATAQEDDVLVELGSQAAVAASAGTTQKETGLAKSLESSKLLQGNAIKRGDVTMLLAKGTSIPCVLNTKIDSTYKGFTTCQISKDVYSANGKVLLLERGSTVFGEQNVDIKQGQARVAVLWSRIETPKGVSVDIDSPATGKLGEMGLGAKVNSHFWKRFGGAIMLSMIQDITSNAATRLQKDGASSNNSNSTTNTQQAAQSMAEKTLDNTINIPPTATVNHGSMINILVVRDVDFGGFMNSVNSNFASDRAASLKGLLNVNGIQPFIDNEAYTEVAINRPYELWTESSDGWMMHKIPGLTYASLKQIATTFANFNKLEINQNQPICSGVMPNGQRGQIVIPSACERDTVSIVVRRPSNTRFSLSNYIDSGRLNDWIDTSTFQSNNLVLPPHLAQQRQSEQAEIEYLNKYLGIPDDVYLQLFELQMLKAKADRDIDKFVRLAVEHKQNICLIGATGSGKTTFTKAVCDLVPIMTRIITIEDTAELDLPNHPNRVHLFYKDVSPKELLKSCMRMKPDRIFLTELRETKHSTI